MNIAIYTKNAPDTYSGGRFYTMFLAIAAASQHTLFYITNIKPIFTRDFVIYKSYDNINFCINNKFEFDNNINLDIILIIPDLTNDSTWFNEFYLKAIKRAYSNNAKLLFVNFETPNWFNKISPTKKDPNLWKSWEKACYYVDATVSLTKLGQKYAEDFFIQKNLTHYYCYPAINQLSADKFKKNGKIKKNQIIVFARFLDRHKGSDKLIEILSEKLAGYTIKIVVGNGNIPKDFHNSIVNKANQFSIKIKYLLKITDAKKYEEIGSSKLLLFLSDFEGYGYPPVEALYMNTPVVAKYLDVLYEVSKNNITYIHDLKEFKNLNLQTIFNKKISHNKNIEIISYYENINNILIDLKNTKPRPFYKYLYLYLIGLNCDFLENLYIQIKFISKKNNLQNNYNIMIFGTGEYAKIWTTWCIKNNKNILAYLVSDKSNKTMFLNKPILLIKDFENRKNTSLIISTISTISALNILKLIPSIKMSQIYFAENTSDFKTPLSINKIIKDSLKLSIKKLILKMKVKT